MPVLSCHRGPLELSRRDPRRQQASWEGRPPRGGSDWAWSPPCVQRRRAGAGLWRRGQGRRSGST